MVCGANGEDYRLISLNIPLKCHAIRTPDTANDIGDNLRILTCANLLNGNMSLKSAKRCANYLELNIPFWSWDEAVAKFAENGRIVRL